MLERHPDVLANFDQWLGLTDLSGSPILTRSREEEEGNKILHSAVQISTAVQYS